MLWIHIGEDVKKQENMPQEVRVDVGGIHKHVFDDTTTACI